MWFTQMHREKYPSTIYVTIKPLNKPSHFRPGLRSALDGDIEHIRREYEELQLEVDE
jgi:hypothetical protein